ncbi:MAG: hypothetical protein NVSMB68_02870 [Thermoanaerobaculia bacterium]
MLRKAGLSAMLVLALASVSLASKPKPMKCDSWACKGDSCSPAKYQTVRHAFLPPWILASPTYGAALTESGVGMLAILLGVAVRRSRRPVAGQEAPSVKASANS